jgi:hypothetical protein
MSSSASRTTRARSGCAVARPKTPNKQEASADVPDFRNCLAVKLPSLAPACVLEIGNLE